MGIRERLDTLSRGELAGLILVVVVTLGGAGLWYARSLPKPVALAASPALPAVASGSGSAAVSSGSPSAAPIIVDVTGWVRKPGVYEFEAGDRVVDALTRAGGAREGADLTLLNLAAPLTDGTQVIVAKEGAAPAPAGTSTGATGTGTTAGGAALVNINTASETELETLSGVGPVTAAAIIQYRTEHGPFASVDDLMDVSGIGPATLEELRPQVTV